MNIINEIKTIKSESDLLYLKSIIDSQIEQNYYRKENFMFHDSLDEYLYVVNFENDYHTYSTGKKAYDVFIENSDALNITRKTKDLFPTFELLMER